MQKSKVTLKTYTGERVQPKGVGGVDVVYKQQRCRLPVTVVKGNVPMLFGRDWLAKLKLDWGELFPAVAVNALQPNSPVEALAAEFPEVFSDKLGCLKDFKVHIPVPEGVQPRFFKPRPVSHALRGRVEEELDKLEEQGVWRKVQYARWAAPIVPVPKDPKNPAGPLRICGDYKITVNKDEPLDSYPVPSTEDQLATFAGGQKFTKLDLSQAYQQLEFDDQSRELLTINTHRGLYQPTRLQFGVHSATGIFQREMDRRLSRIPFVKVRIDDILISGKTDEEHLSNMGQVLRILKESGLTLRRSKCAFLQDEVTYCGYVVGKEGIRPMPSNVEAVQDAPAPTNVSELRSFLGMVNYYHAYLSRMATMTEPLHQLLRKDVRWAWGEKCKVAFVAVKKMLCTAPLLVHYDPSKPIVVHCDTSPYGLGVVLSHVMDDGMERPVSYASRTLSAAERNYAHVEKDGLALVYAVRKFHQFLFGNRFMLYTDHKPLLGLFSEKTELPARAAARVLRWALLLSAYDYVLRHRSRVSNANADGLSRLPIDARNGDLSRAVLSVSMMELVASPVSEKEVRAATRTDPVLGVVLNRVLEGWGDGVESRAELKARGAQWAQSGTFRLTSTHSNCQNSTKRVVFSSRANVIVEI